jgi:hypothetical protein
MRRLALGLASALFLPSLASAQEGTFQVIDAKLTSGVENKAAVDDKTTFTTGEKAWVWLNLKPASDTATIAMRWSWNGNPVWTMEAKPVKLGRTWYYKTIDQPGEWKVDILDNADTVLKTLTLTATGEPLYPAATGAAPAAAAPGTGAAPATDVGESAHLGVVELKLAEDVKDRQPVNPGTTFTTGAKVYTWVSLKVKEPETQVKYRYYLNDAAVYTSNPQTVKQADAWKTWAYKTVDRAGSWKVEILDADDKAVFAQTFTVQ